MAWTVTLDKVEKDTTNANIIATMTITNGADVRVTNRIPGNDLTNAGLADLAAKLVATFQARENAIGALTLGPVTPVAVPPDPVQAALQNLAQAQQKATLLALSDDPDVQAAQAAYKQATGAVTPLPPVLKAP